MLWAFLDESQGTQFEAQAGLHSATKTDYQVLRRRCLRLINGPHRWVIIGKGCYPADTVSNCGAGARV